MKVLIVGAGAVGSVLASELAKEKKISSIICGAYDLKDAKKFVLNNKKVKIVQIDASDVKSIVKAAKGANLIINASLPNFNKNIMEASLKVKAHYQDLCSHLKDLKHAEQLQFHERFKKAKLVGLINTGVAPGITNLLARKLCNQCDKVRDIRIMLLEDLRSKEVVFSWSPDVILDELKSSPLTYKNGKFKLAKPFGDPEVYTFPAPIGKRNMVNLYGDEVSTLPLYLDIENIDFKSGGSEMELAKSLYELGIFSTDKISTGKGVTSPFEVFSKIMPKVPTPEKMNQMVEDGKVENAVFVSAVEVVGKKNNKEITLTNTIIYPDLKQIFKKLKGATYIAYPTGIAAASFAKIIPKLKTFGVFPPENLDTEMQNSVLSDLKKHGVSVITSTSRN